MKPIQSIRSALIVTAMGAMSLAACDRPTHSHSDAGVTRTTAMINPLADPNATQPTATAMNGPVSRDPHSASNGASTAPTHTSTIALARQEHTAWIVQPDGDTVSVIDLGTRALNG